MNNERYVNRQESLDFNCFYHIYNRAVGNEKLFLSDKDYFYFIEKLKRYLLPILEIYAYCLIPNHFHLLVKTKDNQEIITYKNQILENATDLIFGKPFKNFFNSYSKSFNKAHNRMGRLFIQPYKRIRVENERYIKTLICYIHKNPIHHGLANRFDDWKYSSYNSFVKNNAVFVSINEALSFFETINDFKHYHEAYKKSEDEREYIIE